MSPALSFQIRGERFTGGSSRLVARSVFAQCGPGAPLSRFGASQLQSGSHDGWVPPRGMRVRLMARRRARVETSPGTFRTHTSLFRQVEDVRAPVNANDCSAYRIPVHLTRSSSVTAFKHHGVGRSCQNRGSAVR